MNRFQQNVSDRELARRALEGDRYAFRQIVENTEKLVLHIVNSMVIRKEDREDLAQDIYLKAFRSLGGFRHEARLSSWIARIAYNTCISHLQRKKIPVVPSFDADAEADLITGDDPFQLLTQKELSGAIQECIKKLPPLYGTLISLFHISSFSLSEICKITDLPEGTVKSYLYRARKDLLKQILSIYINKEVL